MMLWNTRWFTLVSWACYICGSKDHVDHQWSAHPEYGIRICGEADKVAHLELVLQLFDKHLVLEIRLESVIAALLPKTSIPSSWIRIQGERREGSMSQRSTSWSNHTWRYTNTTRMRRWQPTAIPWFKRGLPTRCAVHFSIKSILVPKHWIAEFTKVWLLSEAKGPQ